MWRFLFRNLRGSRVIVGFAVSLTFIQVAADILTAFPLKFILDKVVHHIDPVVPVVGGLLSRLDPLGTRNGLNDNEVHTQMGVLLFSTVLLLGLSVTSAVLSYIQVLIAARVGSRLSNRLRDRLFDHMQHLSLEWHGRQRTGDLVQRITGNILDVEKLVTDGLVDLLAGVLTLVGILIVMVLLNWQFTVLCMVIVPALFLTVLPCSLTIFLTYSKQLYQPMRNLSKLMNLASGAAAGAARIQEVLDQPPEVKEATVAYTGPNRVSGDVIFRGVVFGYSPGQPVLTGI